jgi:hypothetical protein
VGEWNDLHPAGALQGPQRGRETDTLPYATNHHRGANERTDHDSADDNGAHHNSADDNGAHHNSTGHDRPNHHNSTGHDRPNHDHCATAATDHCTSDHIGSHGYCYTA